MLDVDSDNKRISLGIKQLYDDPWPNLVSRFRPDHEQEGRVARIQDRGLIVDLGESVEGYVPGSHCGVPADRVEEYYAAGDAVSLRVIASDESERRIVLEVLEVPEKKRGSGADEADEADTASADEEGTASADTEDTASADEEGTASAEESPTTSD